MSAIGEKGIAFEKIFLRFLQISSVDDSRKRMIYSFCADVSAEVWSSSRRHDTSSSPALPVSPPHWEVSTAAVRSPRRRQRAAADRRRSSSTVTATAPTAGGGVLKEEPVQFPVTFHTSAAYCVTKIKLYATFSMYFRVLSFKHII